MCNLSPTIMGQPTAESHLTTGGQNSFEHFAHLDISQQSPNSTVAHAILNNGHNPEQDHFIPRRITGLELAVRHSTTEVDESTFHRYRVDRDKAADEEVVQSRQCCRSDRPCGQRRPNDRKEWRKKNRQRQVFDIYSMRRQRTVTQASNWS
jgi:hypothetical protein